jgi:hypothetical protein
MLATRTSTRPPVLEAPVRNHYFYGKLLDVYHFEMETQYHNAKRWLLNRLVTGYGVVCGLDVTPGAETNEIWIEPGVALDKWGREIIVDQRTGPIAIPDRFLEPDEGDEGDDEDEEHGEDEDDEDRSVTGHSATSQEGYDDRRRRHRHDASQPQHDDPPSRRRRRDDDKDHGHGDADEPHHDHDHGHHHRGHWLQVRICYLECETDPTPVFAGDCDTAQPCAPGTIRERFKVEFERGRHPYPDPDCLAPDVFPGDRLDYAALARYVTESCPDVPADPCIVLANIRLAGDRGGHACDRDNIDITVRPIVYGNDLLFKLMLSDEAADRESRNYRAKG